MLSEAVVKRKAILWRMGRVLKLARWTWINVTALTAGAGHDVGERRNALTLVQIDTRANCDVIVMVHGEAKMLPSFCLAPKAQKT